MDFCKTEAARIGGLVTIPRVLASPLRPVDEVRCGSWLRDNALTQPATVHDPVNVVRHGRSEQFFLLDDQGPPPSHRVECWARSGSRSARNGSPYSRCQ